MPSAYQRPRLTWIKRRARSYLRAFNVPRRVAVRSAAQDYHYFVGPARPALVLHVGGRA